MTAVPNSGSGKRAPRPACRHCGAPLLDARAETSGFCCAGCAYVHRLVHEQGLAGYYRLKDTVTAPADDAVFQPRDYAWLEAAQAEAEQRVAGTATVPELVLDVQGISCAGCVWLIERLFQPLPGARDVIVNAQTGQLRLRWVPGLFSAAEFARKLQTFGYLLGPAGAGPDETESRDLVRRIGLCAAFAMNVMLFTLPTYFGLEASATYARLFGTINLVFGTLSLLVGGGYFIGRAARALRAGALHIDLPIALGVVGAYAGSFYGWLSGEARFVYFDFVATFMLLMLVGRWAQVRAVERNQRRLLSRQPQPQRVRVVQADATRPAAPDALQAEQVFLLAAGQMNPVEGKLETETAAFSLASINGEAEPRVFRQGQRVPAGAINVTRSDVRLTATQPWRDSLLAQLLRSGDARGWRQRLLERIVQGYLYAIIVGSLASGAVWWWLTRDALHAGAVATAVLVVSCPCALGLALPLVDEMALVALRRRGVFVRNPELWGKLGQVRTLVFDKTGTLTLEAPALLNPEALTTLAPDARAALFTLVRDNPHPVAQALLENLLVDGPPAALASAVRETVGQGVELEAFGHRWALGQPIWALAGATAAPEAPPGSVVLACAGQVRATFRFADLARADARAELARLTARGLQTYILSGDQTEKVASLARELGLPAERGLGGRSPQQKADWLAQHDRHDTLMLGDGLNDSLAFDRAFCRGTPVIHRGQLAQKADFYYLGKGIGGIHALFAVDAVRRQTQWLVLVVAVLYNAVTVALAMAGYINPLVAAVLMPTNSLLTLLLATGAMRRAFKAT